jgi:hypothetical protein
VLDEYRQQVKALTRTSEPEDLEKLSVPYEYALKQRCHRLRTLPFAGGLFDQPYLLLLCFNIVDEEETLWVIDKKKIEERNRQLQQEHNAPNRPATRT